MVSTSSRAADTPDRAISRILAAASRPAQAAPEALRVLCLAFGWSFGALWSADDTANLLRCAGLWGKGGLREGGLAAATRRLAIPPGVGLPGRVWADGQPHQMEDLSAGDGTERAEEARRAGLLAAVGFPVSASGRTLGVLEFLGRRVKPLDDDQLAVVRTAGRELGQLLLLAEAQGALRASDAYRAAIVSAAPDGIIVFDPEGRVVDVNLAAERMLGYRREHAVGAPIAELLSPPPVWRPLADARAESRSVQSESTIRRADGTEILARVTVAPSCTSAPLFIAFVHDVTELRRLELRNAHFAALVSSAHDAILSESLEGVIQSWNPAAEQMYGFASAEAIGRSFAMLVPPDRLEDVRRTLTAIQAGETVPLIEAVRMRKDKTRFDAALTISPIRRETTGPILGASVISRDVSEQKRTEEALRRSEERYRSLVHASTAVVWGTDAAGRTFEPSPTWDAYTGQRCPGGLGWGWLEMLHPDDRARMREQWAHGEAGGLRVIEEEVRVWNAESRGYRRCLGRGVALFDAEGAVREWVGALSDIDDRKRAEDMARFLAHATAQLNGSLDAQRTVDATARLAVPALADVSAVLLAQEDGAVHLVAAAHRDPSLSAKILEAGRRFSTSQERPSGPGAVIRTGRAEILPELTDTDLAACTDDGELLAALREARVRSYLCVPMRARGRTLGALCVVRLEGADRCFDGADLAVAEELSGRAALAVDNARLFARAKQAALAREDFLTIASHELLTPLVPLKLAVQTLLKRARAGEDAVSSTSAARFLTAIEYSTTRLESLVRDLLDISDLATERLALQIHSVDVGALVSGVIERSADMLSRARCEVRVDTRGATEVRADRRWLETAFANLLSNAAKYGRERPIEVLVNGGPDVIQLSVRDHGIGIAPEEQARIFERFERAVSTRHYGGFGLGLWSVGRIVQAHGGSVRVESRPGEGATFTLDLPRRERGGS